MEGSSRETEVEEASMAQQQQQLLLFQQLQRQKQRDAIISRFPSNIDAHLRPQNHHRSSQSPNPNPNPNPQTSSNVPTTNGSFSSSSQQQHKGSNPIELQMAYQDAWRVCHPHFKRSFSSLEDACERLLPYHVVADYEAEEDDKIFDSDTTGQILSRSQLWDHNIAAKVAEFTATFEKQVLAFNIISHKQELGEFRTEEKLMVEQLLLQEERRSLIELRAQLDSRQKAGRETRESNLRMAAMAHADHARAESQAHSEMMVRAPIRASVLGSQISNIAIGHDMADQDQVANPDEIMNGWGNNIQTDEKEPSEDFLNDEETENGEAAMQSEWRGGGELDLNTR